MKILLIFPKIVKIYSNFSRKFGQKFRKSKKYAFVKIANRSKTLAKIQWKPVTVYTALENYTIFLQQFFSVSEVGLSLPLRAPLLQTELGKTNLKFQFFQCWGQSTYFRNLWSLVIIVLPLKFLINIDIKFRTKIAKAN